MRLARRERQHTAGVALLPQHRPSVEFRPNKTPVTSVSGTPCVVCLRPSALWCQWCVLLGPCAVWSSSTSDAPLLVCQLRHRHSRRRRRLRLRRRHEPSTDMLWYCSSFPLHLSTVGSSVTCLKPCLPSDSYPFVFRLRGDISPTPSRCTRHLAACRASTLRTHLCLVLNFNSFSLPHMSMSSQGTWTIALQSTPSIFT